MEQMVWPVALALVQTCLESVPMGSSGGEGTLPPTPPHTTSGQPWSEILHTDLLCAFWILERFNETTLLFMKVGNPVPSSLSAPGGQVRGGVDEAQPRPCPALLHGLGTFLPSLIMFFSMDESFPGTSQTLTQIGFTQADSAAFHTHQDTSEV